MEHFPDALTEVSGNFLPTEAFALLGWWVTPIALTAPLREKPGDAACGSMCARDVTLKLPEGTETLRIVDRQARVRRSSSQFRPTGVLRHTRR